MNRPSPRRLAALLAVVAAITASCSGGSSAEESTTTITEALPATTTPPTTAATTTTSPSLRVAVAGAPEGLRTIAADLYAWLAGERPTAPDLPQGLAAHLRGVAPRPGLQIEATATVWDLPDESLVGVVTHADDAILAIDEGDGWRIVGAKLPTFGRDYWYGEPRDWTLLVLGSDAQYGEDQQRLRADSIHLVTLVPDRRAGAIVGFPRDSWVSSPYGRMKINGVMQGRGPEAMVETVEGLTALDIDAYLVTGFTGFVGLIDNFGGLVIDLPEAIRSGVRFQANYEPGVQEMDGDRTLWLARIRKTLANGDFDRSLNQGLIMQAALAESQRRGIGELPWHVRNLLVHIWTDLPLEDLVQLAATTYELDPALLTNVVLPGSVGTAGAASVVYLGSGAEAVYRDLEDGILDEE